MIESSEAYTEHHLKDPKDDRHFHLVRVGEEKAILSELPNLNSKMS